MTFLPIVERELRVASRRKATYWMRFLLAGGVFAVWLLLLLMAPARAPLPRGQLLFASLSVLLLVFCFFSGIFLTADSVSEERREGTLGLLFLTDLDGYDVALGKLLATSLHAFYGLLAVLPLLAYSMLIGGVTPGEFWRMSLALTLTLTFSLSVGLLVSVHNRETRQAMGAAALVMLAMCLGPPMLSGLIQVIFKAGWPKLLGWLSPLWTVGYAFEATYQARAGAWQFWGSLVVSLLLIAGALVAAGLGAAKAWREKAESRKSEVEVAWSGLRFPERGSALRVRLLDQDPYCWLATRDRLPRMVAWVLLIACLAAWFASICFSMLPPFTPVSLGIALMITYLAHHALKWLVAIEASRRLSDDRKNGTLELILVSPLTIEDLVRGQQQALRRMFRWPFVVAGSMNAFLLVVVCASAGQMGYDEAVGLCEVLIGGIVLLFVDFSAIGWVGMWMGMAAKRHHRAVLGTLARIMVVPWAANFFLVLLIVGGAGLGLRTALALSPFWFGLAAVLELAFRNRARIGLFAALRLVAGDTTLNPSHPAFLDEAARLSAAPAQAS
jgi:ABC-type transport system involved in multi-copper enzyme maturation permease subunit